MKRKIRVTFDSSIKQKFNIAGEVLVTYIRLTQDENKQLNISYKWKNLDSRFDCETANKKEYMRTSEVSAWFNEPIYLHNIQSCPVYLTDIELVVVDENCNNTTSKYNVLYHWQSVNEKNEVIDKGQFTDSDIGKTVFITASSKK